MNLFLNKFKRPEDRATEIARQKSCQPVAAFGPRGRSSGGFCLLLMASGDLAETRKALRDLF
jgi:hypothetical protein